MRASARAHVSLVRLLHLNFRSRVGVRSLEEKNKLKCQSLLCRASSDSAWNWSWRCFYTNKARYEAIGATHPDGGHHSGVCSLYCAAKKPSSRSITAFTEHGCIAFEPSSSLQITNLRTTYALIPCLGQKIARHGCI